MTFRLLCMFEGLLCMFEGRLLRGKVDPCQRPFYDVFRVPSCIVALFEFQTALLKCFSSHSISFDWSPQGKGLARRPPWGPMDDIKSNPRICNHAAIIKISRMYPVVGGLVRHNRSKLEKSKYHRDVANANIMEFA